MTAVLETAGLTHRGCVRATNEDHFLVARMERVLKTLATSLPAGEIPTRFAESGTLMMVADGMGGTAGGEVASRTAISFLIQMLLDIPDWVLRADDTSAEKLMSRGARYSRAVHEEIKETARSEPDLSGMGTTLTVAYAIGTTLFVFHVGDSRAYLSRGGVLGQLTRDHTQAQRLVERGLLSSREAGAHRSRHLLTNVLGGVTTRGEADISRLALRDRDRLLLCTDGLNAVASDSEISEILAAAAEPEATCRALVDLALDRDAPDNVTVVVAHATADVGSTRD